MSAFVTEPCANYRISREADGVFTVSYRDANGDLFLVGTADDYESSREIALADSAFTQERWS